MTRSAIVVGAGASKGLGGALCRRFAREGLHAIPSGRTPEKVEALAEEIRAAGGAATAIAADATDPAGVAQLFEAAVKAGGPPEIVVHNAGNMAAGPILEMEPEFFEASWRICCHAGFLVAREAVRHLLPAGGGSLFFTGATASMRARPPFIAFAAAKAAERALAFGLAREFGPQGIHVGHVVVDGVIDGDQVNERFPELKQRLGEDGMLAPDAIADAFWMLHRQPRSAWSPELVVRPFKESF